MAEFRRAVITQKGLALLAKAQADEVPISITRAVSGDGEYTDSESLIEREALKDPKQAFAPTSIIRRNDTTVLVRFAITNAPPGDPLLHGYYVREVGIYADDPDEGEILYSIAIAGEGTCDYLPAYGGTLPTTIGVSFVIEVANADEVIIQTDISAYALAEDVQDWIAEHAALPTHITAEERATWNAKENATDWEEYTLLSSGWSNGQYSLEADFPSADYDIVNVQPTANTTEAMRKAWSKADCGGYSDTNIITAHGTVPAIDIVLGLCVRERG